MKRVGLIIDEATQGSTASFACPHCGKEYKSEAALNKHIEKEHQPEGGGEDA